MFPRTVIDIFKAMLEAFIGSGQTLTGTVPYLRIDLRYAKILI